MKRYAIDVVILPPAPVMDLALAVNQLLCETRPANIVLDKTHYLPHITLAMGCLPEGRLEEAFSVLQAIASQQAAPELHVPWIKTVDTASGDTVVSFDITPSPELVSLHETIVAGLRPLLTQDAGEADLYDLPPISPSSIDWINQYIPLHSFEHFWPHITLGFGDAPGDFQPFSFLASRLAICHLGNHCTCREVLREVHLERM
jgi:hypothetical protein